ncbi:MAG: bifunctional diguanylate cyclase/phosphodiesterase [Mycobacteriaceae bacterium]|nr:bifunctional diguanylate cyclase/phosphodiesterase [Mycobacteriaceae bacterium]
MARTTGAFFVMGGLLGVAITALAPQGPGNRTVVVAAAFVAVVAGMAVLALGERIPTRAHPALVVLATLLVTVAIHWFPNEVATTTLSAFFVFIACDAAFFFARQVAVGVIGLAVVCCMVALGSRAELPWWSGLIPSGVTMVVGAVVTVLARLAADADVDALTGLLNRRGFDRLLNVEISRAGRLDQRPALVLVDLDRFGKINDHLGQRAGDVVLQQVTDAWLQLLAPEQTLARFGGDVFAVLLPNTTEQAAVGLADRMRAAITTGCSAGVTTWQPGESASLLVSRADVGLYRAKQAGRNRTMLESARRVAAGAGGEEERPEAIDHTRLDVQYQPVVSLSAGGKAVGVEAVLRWSAPAPEVTPEGLARAADDYDLVAALDQAVLRRACEDAVRLMDTFADLALDLNVNVSGGELATEDYAARVEQILAQTGWPPDRLVLEVTESELSAESQNTIDNLNRLRAHGVKVAIDDFGTGYSSLSRLAALPGDILKVDESFVAALTSNSPAPPLLSVIKALGKALDMEVVAEGGQAEHQAAVLTDLGFALAQGYHYSDSPDIVQLLSELNEGAESPAPR